MLSSCRAAAARFNLRSHLLVVAWLMALACANANVTGDGHPTPHDPAQNGNESSDPAGGDKPVTLPVDENGNPQVGNIGLRYVGRANSANVLSWSGSALELNFSGTDATFTFHANAGNTFVGVNVNGAFQGNVFVQEGQPIAIGPFASGNQIIRLTKLTEAKLGTISLQSLSANGSLNVPQFASRKIEVIGDSIASAYGISGTNANCINSSATEDALSAFPSLLGNTLGADVSIVSYSGRGVYRNDVSDLNNALPTMPTLWTRTTANSNNNTFSYSASSTPDVFVIMLGTNDYEYMQNNNGTLTPLRAAIDHNVFVSTYTQFAQSILSACPDAKILLCGSPLLSDTYPSSSDAQHTSLATDLNSVVANLNTSQVQAIDIASLPDAQKTGCGGHPNRTAHQQMATTLTAALRNWLGW